MYERYIKEINGRYQVLSPNNLNIRSKNSIEKRTNEKIFTTNMIKRGDIIYMLIL